MPWVSRNDAGQINGVFGVEQYEGQEFLRDDDQELLDFLAGANRPPPQPPSTAVADQQLFQALERLQLNYGADLRSLLSPSFQPQPEGGDVADRSS